MAQRSSDWRLEVPPVLWPVPLLDAPAMLDKANPADLLGDRVIAGDPDAGLWFYELRLVAPPHTHEGEQVVGVLPEIDWYRQRRDDSYIAIPRPAPVTRVWYEVGKYMDREDRPVLPSQDDVRPDRRAAHLVPQVDEPPVRWPRNCAEERGVTGARCWIGGRPGFRIVSEPFKQQDPSGIDFTQGLDGLDRPVIAPVVRVLEEAEWYRLLDAGVAGADDMDGIWHAEASLVWLE